MAQGLDRGSSNDTTARKKILLVDDVKLFIELEKTFFQRKDKFEVLTACNGIEAFEVVAAEKPDLVYMDLYMPELNGDECCRMIKNLESGKNIPVVMVTSAGNEEDRNNCLEAGCDEIITKPINRSQFLSVAKKYLEVHDRKEPRYAVHVKVMFGANMDQRLTDFTVNLNSGGLFLSSSVLLPVGTELHIEFSLQERETAVQCKARVAWVNEPNSPTKRDLPVGMGLQFVDLSDAEINAIHDYIEKNKLTADW